jgi:amidohydrolase
MPLLMNIQSEILAQARKIFKRQVAWRRHLHRYPEISFQEHKTTAFLKQEVRKLGLRLMPLKMKTGLFAELTGIGSGPIVAVRTDIDALPIEEQTGLSYKSEHPVRMHACGHDMHMATVLGTASVLASVKQHFDGTVRFIFQPAEECPPGGARPMIENGALEGVSRIFGLHVDPNLAVGKISVRDGVTMGSVYDFDLIIAGRSGHAARPQNAVDAIATAAEVIESVQKVISREIDPVSPAVITFGKIEGGVARNVIADKVRLTGTARTLSETAFNLYGKGKVLETPQVLGGEDFACYLQKVPGAMFRLGTRNKKIGADKSWHAADFKVDEVALTVGTALLAMSVLDELSGGTIR